MPAIWDSLSDEQRELLVENLVLYKYERDEIIFNEGSDCDTLFLLLRGRVTMRRLGLGGQSQIVRIVEPGAMFGYAAAFEGNAHESTAMASEDTLIAAFPMSLVFHLIWENGNFAMLFIKELSALLGLSVKRTMSLTQKHIRGRLAESLLRMKEKYGLEEDCQTLAIYVSRDDLAKMSNMTTSNAIRTLSSFAKEGIIAIAGRKIKIIEENELKHISDLG